MPGGSATGGGDPAATRVRVRPSDDHGDEGRESRWRRRGRRTRRSPQLRGPPTVGVRACHLHVDD